MAGFFARVSSVFKANANAALDSLEDPEKMLDQMLREMDDQYRKAKSGVATAMAGEKSLKKEIDDNARQASEWESRAMAAVKEGKDDLAKKALARKKEHGSVVETLKPQWEASVQNCEKLKERLRDLDQKIQQARRKRSSIVARQKTAQAQKKIQSAISGMDSSGAFDTFSRMEQKVGGLEARTDAELELSVDVESDLEKEFKALGDTEVDDDLAALKAKMEKKGKK